MKVLIFTSASPFHELTGALAGGAEYALRSIAESLAARGHNVHYLTCTSGLIEPKVTEVNNVKVHIFNQKLRLKRLPRFSELLIFNLLNIVIYLNDKLKSPWPRFRRNICLLAEKFRFPEENHPCVFYMSELHEKINFDVVHCYSSPPDIAIAEELKRRYQLPYTVRMGGRFYYNFYKMLRGGKAERYFNLLKRSFDNADFFSFNSESLYEESRNYFSDIGIQFPENRSNILDIGIDVDSIQNILAKIKTTPKGNDKIFNVVCVGKFKEGSKRQDLLLEVVSKIKNEKNKFFDKEIHVDFVGGGDLLQKHIDLAVELNVIDQCSFHGSVPKQKVFEFLLSADLFVFPTEFEGSSKALAEALLAETPVLASNIPANIELLKPSDGGLLFENNVEDLFFNLQYVISNYDKVVEKTMLGKKFILENLNSSLQVKKYEQLFDQLSKSSLH